MIPPDIESQGGPGLTYSDLSRLIALGHKTPESTRRVVNIVWWSGCTISLLSIVGLFGVVSAGYLGAMNIETTAKAAALLALGIIAGIAACSLGDCAKAIMNHNAMGRLQTRLIRMQGEIPTEGTARASDQHVRELFPYIYRAVGNKMDYNQQAACYRDEATRPFFLEYIDRGIASNTFYWKFTHDLGGIERENYASLPSPSELSSTSTSEDDD